MRSVRQTGLIVVGLVLCGLGAWGAHLGAADSRTAVGGDVPLEYLPSSETALALSLGHRPALADVFWVRGVLYFGGEMNNRRKYEWLTQYIDLVTALDPDFVDVYQWGGMALIVRQNQVEFEDVMMANEILERGTERFVDNWELPMSAMANCSFYVTPRSADEAEALQACRARFMRIAAFRPGAPASLALLATQQVSEEEVEARPQLCGLIKDIYLLHEKDPEVRGQLEARLLSGLCGATASEELVSLREQFRRMQQLSYPYVPEDLLVQIVETGAWDRVSAERANKEE